MANAKEKLLIKRYASRRLYNTETSDYVTLEDISGFIRDGRDVQIMDLKSGDDGLRFPFLSLFSCLSFHVSLIILSPSPSRTDHVAEGGWRSAAPPAIVALGNVHRQG